MSSFIVAVLGREIKKRLRKLANLDFILKDAHRQLHLLIDREGPAPGQPAAKNNIFIIAPNQGKHDRNALFDRSLAINHIIAVPAQPLQVDRGALFAKIFDFERGGQGPQPVRGETAGIPFRLSRR